jgi:membrane dipeptidase
MTSVPSHSTRAAEILEQAIVWDNVWPVDLGGDHAYDNGWDKLDRFASCGISMLSITLAGDNQNISEAAQLVAWARSYLLSKPDRYRLVERVEDVLEAKRQGLLGVGLHFEGTRCLERNLDMVEAFYKLGVRQNILAFNNTNCAGGGCADANDPGLTAYGRKLVVEMQRVGMLVDLSHTGYRTTMDALEMATAPMVFSHSNSGAIHPSFRNITDEQVLACARTGGIVGVSGSSGYLGDELCRTETLFRHVDHYVQLVGASHVGLGIDVVFNHEKLSDYIRQRSDEWPIAKDPNWPGFRYVMPEQIAELAEIMLRQGYTDEHVFSILGKNYIRICGEVWR